MIWASSARSSESTSISSQVASRRLAPASAPSSSSASLIRCSTASRVRIISVMVSVPGWLVGGRSAGRRAVPLDDGGAVDEAGAGGREQDPRARPEPAFGGRMAERERQGGGPGVALLADAGHDPLG